MRAHWWFDQGYTLYSFWVTGAQVAQLIRQSAAEETGFFGLLTPEVCPQLRQMYARWVPEMFLDEVVSPACR